MRKKHKTCRMRKMKNAGAALALCASFLFSGAALAHPPSEVSLKHVPSEGVIKIVALHGVKDPSDHYIKEYVVRVDGREIGRIDMELQESREKSVTEFVAPDLVKGSVVEVTAECNKSGRGGARLVIE